MKRMSLVPFFLLMPFIDGRNKNWAKKAGYYVNEKGGYDQFAMGQAHNNQVSHIHRGKLDPVLLTRMQQQPIQNERLIVFSKNLDQKVVSLKQKGYKIVRSLPIIDAFVVEASQDDVGILEQQGDIDYILCDNQANAQMDIARKSLYRSTLEPMPYTGAGVGIAFLDTGIYPHPDFMNPQIRITGFVDFVHHQRRPYDDNGHGTFVAGVAAGSGMASGGKYRGVATNASIIGVKVMNQYGSGNVTDILSGLQWVVDHRKTYNIRIVSLSLGMVPQSNNGLDVLSMAVEAVWKKGIVVIVSAGNNGPGWGTITSPGGSPSVITVGALDDQRTIDYRDDRVSSISSRGPSYAGNNKPDIVAPGMNITSCGVPDKMQYRRLKSEEQYYKTMSGTSVSTPLVAGIVALVLQKNSKLSPDEVKNLFIKNAVRVDKDNRSSGYGRIFIPDLFRVSA